jgi:hypothetical protein
MLTNLTNKAKKETMDLYMTNLTSQPIRDPAWQ